MNYKKLIQKFHKKRILIKLMQDICKLFSFGLIIFLLISIFENIFYLEKINRKIIFFLFSGTSSLLTIYIIVKYIISYKSIFNNYSNEKIAKDIGKKNPQIADQLINAIQIQKLKNAKKDLVKMALGIINNKLSKLHLEILDFQLPKIHLQRLLSIALFFIIITSSTNIKDASYRIIKHDNHFDVPVPFHLHSLTGDINALSGDTLDININGVGQLPDSIKLFWDDTISKKNKMIALDKNGKSYRYSFQNIQNNIIYWAEFENQKLFSKWDKILTKKSEINIKKRPEVVETTFKIIPPKYTTLKEITYNQPDVNQIELLEGSEIEIHLLTNNNLHSAWFTKGAERKKLDVNNNKITGSIQIMDDLKIAIYFINLEYIPNINPTEYTFIAKNDLPPNLLVKYPKKDFDIDELYSVPLNINAIDDLGVNKIWIEYSIYNADFPNLKQNIDTLMLSIQQRNNRNVFIEKNWDISELNILMGDELHFHILASDYNIYNNNITKSQKIIGRFPSLENIFSEIETYENESQDWMEEIKEEISDISEIAEDIKHELLKSEEMSWEQNEKINETFNEFNEIQKQIEKVNNNLEKIMNEADKNNLFTDDLINKFEKFQNMLKDIMTSELMEAIQKLNESMKDMNINQLMDALENYEFNIQKFEEQIDRFIDMFELALAEQKLNELSEHIENMIAKQEQLIEDIKNNKETKILTNKSIRQENRFSDFEHLSKESQTAINNISQYAAQNLEEMLNDKLINETKNALQDQSEKISSNNDNALDPANDSNKNLKEISSLINEIIEQFNNENKQKMSKEFISIINNLFVMSNEQEQLIQESIGLRSNSPKIREINQMQYNLDKELVSITKQLINLSNKTFFVNPKINRLIGKLKSRISKTISLFEQKQISTAKKEQLSILNNLNEIILLMLSSMQEMQNSNAVSGFEQFMESLKDISKQQQGINEGTSQCMQLGGSQQQQLMKELMKQQQELKEKLGECIGNNPGQDPGGGLSKAQEEMEEIIQDFKNKNITQQTMERQQKILSRMLDNQKSLQQKDFENKRESKIAQEFIYDGPLGLPVNFGDKNILLMNAMEDAMNENFSFEYEKLIQLYFMKLQKVADENEN